jgi:hypothetical protein
VQHDFFSRSAALRPSKPKPGFDPNTRACGARKCLLLEDLFAALKGRSSTKLPKELFTFFTGRVVSARESGILKMPFQNPLVSESGFVKMYYFAWLAREIFIDRGSAFRL